MRFYQLQITWKYHLHIIFIYMYICINTHHIYEYIYGLIWNVTNDGFLRVFEEYICGIKDIYVGIWRMITKLIITETTITITNVNIKIIININTIIIITAEIKDVPSRERKKRLAPISPWRPVLPVYDDGDNDNDDNHDVKW